MDTNGRSFSYSLHLLNDTIQSHARTSYFTAPFTLMFFSFLCMQLIKLCNYEITNHNPIIYLNVPLVSLFISVLAEDSVP